MFVITYFNNIIIIYLGNKRDYSNYIKWVLYRLYNKQMLIIIKKYKFFTKKMEFIGFIIKLVKL